VDNPRSVADGALTPSLGAFTFPLVLANADDVTTIDDAPLLRAMFYLWERLKMLIEPTGALGAAPLLEGLISANGLRVGVILSGGNVDLSCVDAWRRVVTRGN
jgi:threonine dehydratase